MAGYKLAGVAPATNAAVVVPNDTLDIPDTRGLYVGGAGNIVAILHSGNVPVTFTAVAVGTILDVSVKRILATGTTATNLLALY